MFTNMILLIKLDKSVTLEILAWQRVVTLAVYSYFKTALIKPILRQRCHLNVDESICEKHDFREDL